MQVGLKTKLALLLALLAVASLSMGCMQQKTAQNLKTPKPSATSTTTAKTTSTANVTQLEKDINTTLDNVNQLLNQLNDIGNINFTV